MSFTKAAKAFAAGIVTGLTTFATATLDNHVTMHEWAMVALAVCSATFGVYAVPNKAPKK